MAYTKQTWASGDMISAARLNYMEDGIASALPAINFNIIGGTRGQKDALDSSNTSNAETASTQYVASYVGKIRDGMTATFTNSNATKTITSLTQSQGKINATFTDIPAATTTSKGLVQIGNNLAVNDGIISAIIPTASASALGGIKIGSGLSIDSNGVVSANTLTMPQASADTLGGIRIGNGLSIDNETGVVSVTSSSSSSSSYTLPKATTTTLGGIKIGDGLTVEDGVASVDISAQYVQENINENEKPGTLKTLFSLTQSQGKITANFQPIPDASCTPGQEQNLAAYTHGLISAADLQKLYILNFNNEDDFEYFLINSRAGRKGWVRGINNFIVYDTLSIQDLEVTDTSTQQTTIKSATLKLGETALTEDQLKDLLKLLNN